MKMRAFSTALVALPLALLAVGPAPGDIGGCGNHDQIADPIYHCERRVIIDCARRNALDPSFDVNGCIATEQMPCQRVNRWICEPPPTVRQSQACLDAFQDVDNIRTAYEAIPECIALCPSPSTPPPPPMMMPDASVPDASDVDGGGA